MRPLQHIITVIIILLLGIYYAPGVCLNIYNKGTETLYWAPWKIGKIPFITFINDFNFPSWSTRHKFTRQSSQFHLKLAKGIPFSIVCGACFSPSFLKSNLTIEITNHNFTSVPKRNQNKSIQYTEGYNECIMSYLITEHIKYNGVITCTLYRGKQILKEKLYFDAVNVQIQQIPRNFSSESELKCPELSTTNDNPIMYIWYVKGLPILSTKPTLSISKPIYSINITCFVYNIFTPSVVLQTSYDIHGVSISLIVIIIIVLSLVVFFLVFVGIYRFFCFSLNDG